MVVEEVSSAACPGTGRTSSEPPGPQHWLLDHAKNRPKSENFLSTKTFKALVPSGNNVLAYMFSDILSVFNCTKRLRYEVKKISSFVTTVKCYPIKTSGMKKNALCCPIW